jgi:hypothetical protein
MKVIPMVGCNFKRTTPRELGESFARDGRPIDACPYLASDQEQQRQEFYQGYAQYQRRTHPHP